MRFPGAALCLALAFLVSCATGSQGADNKAPGKTPEVRRQTSTSKNNLPMRLSLQQAVRITLERNPRVAEALAKLGQSQQQAQEAFSDFFPSLQVTYSGAWPKYQVGAGGLGPPDHVSRYDASTAQSRLKLPLVRYPYRIDPYRRFEGGLTVKQTIFSGGKTVSDYTYATLGINSSQLQVEIDRQDLILEVYRAYYSMILAQKVLEVVNESIRTLQRLKALNLKLLEAGVVTKTDVLSTEGELADAYVDRRSAQTDIETYRAALVNLLSYPPESPIEIEDDYKEIPNTYSIPQIYVTAFSNRDDIRQANISIQQAYQAIRSARADLLPTVSVQVGGARTNDDWNVLDPEGSMEWLLSGTLTWNFDMFRSNANVKDKMYVERERVAARQTLVQNVAEEVKTAYLDMKRSEGDISDYRKAVALRTENFALFQRRYQEGDVSYTDVLISQQDLISSKTSYYSSLIGYRVNKAILERRMGILRQ